MLTGKAETKHGTRARASSTRYFFSCFLVSSHPPSWPQALLSPGLPSLRRLSWETCRMACRMAFWTICLLVFCSFTSSSSFPDFSPGANTMTSFSRYTLGFLEVDRQRAGADGGPGNRGAGSRRARRVRAGRSAPRTAPCARSRAAAQRWARAASTMHRSAGGRRRGNPAQLLLGPRASLAIHRRRSRALLPLPPKQEGRKGKPDRKGAGCQYKVCLPLCPPIRNAPRDNVRRPAIFCASGNGD